MRSAALGFLVVVVAGIAILLIQAGGDERVVTQTTGITTIVPVAQMRPGQEACQRPLVTNESFAGVSFTATAALPSPALRVRVLDTTDNRTLATGRVAPGFDVNHLVSATLSRPVGANRSVAVCVRNLGPQGAALWGDDGRTNLCTVAPTSLGCRFQFAHPVSGVSHAYLDGRPVPGTYNMLLLRGRPRTVLSQVRAIMHRASTFKPGFVGPVLWWVLIGLLLLGVPAVLFWALSGLRADRLGYPERAASGR